MKKCKVIFFKFIKLVLLMDCVTNYTQWNLAIKDTIRDSHFVL